jgi:Holliday junction resolvase
MNRIFKSAGQPGEAEADVVAVKENISVTFIECKGYTTRAG